MVGPHEAIEINSVMRAAWVQQRQRHAEQEDGRHSRVGQVGRKLEGSANALRERQAGSSERSPACEDLNIAKRPAVLLPLEDQHGWRDLCRDDQVRQEGQPPAFERARKDSQYLLRACPLPAAAVAVH